MFKIKHAEELIKASSGYARAGFNMFIDGDTEPKSSEYRDKSEWYSLIQGYQFAQKMAKEDGIFFTYPFKCSQSGCFPFKYGGFFVCNSCGNKNVDRDWWKIRVVKDGNAFCCHGIDFINLQESNNYAFGDTYENAIENYRTVILSSTHH